MRVAVQQTRGPVGMNQRKDRNAIGRRAFLKSAGPLAGVISGALRSSGDWPAKAPEVDYAESRYVDGWLRHPVLGDPSFDAFERVAGNPLHTGAPPYGWPVNGFFFPDPISGNWYLYIGDYATGYVGPPPSRCILYRSKDRGRTWENLGVVLHGDAQMFDRDGATPDVSVVFADGRYHMVYDWGTLNFNREGGLAYAWAEKPEGPWHRDAQPITRNSTLDPLLGKYQRTYAATLLRRQHDWLVLAMMDSAPHSWALFAITAPQPQGPYSERTLVRNVEGSYFHPPLLEFYPAFVDGGWVYAPATSVARNRNFQVIFRAPLERATDPAAWEIHRHGSVWHSEDVSHEAYGIWGQTISGWVDAERRLWAMFPSRNKDGFGTINLASRPWAQLLRPKGFHLSGHQAPSLTCLRRSFADFNLNAALRVSGIARILWSYTAPLGPDKPASDAALHPLSMTRHQGLELGPNGWRILAVNAEGMLDVRASGAAPRDGVWNITIRRQAKGTLALALDGEKVWDGTMNAGGGAVGLWVESHSHLSMERFAIAGESQPGTLSFLYTEGLLGAGEGPANGSVRKDATFRFGVGAVGSSAQSRAKWNFMGAGFTLWSPKGPEYGIADIVLDDATVGTVDLHSAEPQSSQPVFHKGSLTDTFHAVSMRPKEGRLVVDSLDVISG